MDMRFFCFNYKSELQAIDNDSFEAKVDSLKKKLGSSDNCDEE